MIDIPGRILITGTDTGVGKTVVTAALADCIIKSGLEVNAVKPFQTGTEETAVTDIEFVYRVLGRTFDIEKACPHRLKKPLSPFYAAKLENINYRKSDIVSTVENSMDENCINLVEGAGGLKVPITKNYYMSDFAKDMELKLIVAARPGLGTVNHTLLTIDHAKSQGLDIMGIVISGYPKRPDLAESTNIPQLAELTDIEILGIIPELDNLDVEMGQTGKLAEKSRDFFINGLGGNLNINKFLT
ncbi:MAG: dethiobiotin synthase [Thermodesulfobacteriota bacterium]